MRNTRFALALLAGPLAAGCAADTPFDEDTDVVDAAGGKADQISGADDPSGLLGDAERRLSQLLTRADIGHTFGVDEDAIPYPDTYWPMVDNGIAVEWLETTGQQCRTPNECDDPQLSPLGKFVSMTQPGSEPDAKAWEVAHHGKDVPNVWIALDAGSDARHNPFVKATLVKQLLDLALSDDETGGEEGGACVHDTCSEGEALESACDPCVTKVCDADDFCCNNRWDDICIDEAAQMCGRSCG